MAKPVLVSPEGALLTSMQSTAGAASNERRANVREYTADFESSELGKPQVASIPALADRIRS